MATKALNYTAAEINQRLNLAGTVAQMSAVNQADIAGLKSKTDSISKQSTQSEEDAIIYETDGGVQVGKIDANGADFTNLKRGGQQVARMSDLPTKDSSINENPSTTNVPTTKAVKDYVDAHSGGGTGDLPISKEDTQSDTEEQVWGNNEETDTYAKIDNKGLSAKNINILDDCLVVYNGTQLAIYKNILGTNKYIEYSIVHVYSTDTDPSHVPDNADYWRVSTSYVCSRRGTIFTRLYKCLEANENEFVFHIKDAADYTGGYHGDEKYTDIHFFLDSEELNLTSSFTKKGNHFEFIVTSNMYDTLNDITDVVAVHYKRTIITDDGYITQNRVVFQKSTILNEVFAGLCCVSKEVASKWFAEDLVVHTCVGDSTSTFPTIISDKPVVCFYNPTNKVMVEVTSKIIYGIEPEMLKLSIWDRSGDTKFYYRSPGNTTSLNVSQGDEYKVELMYKLKI